MNSIEVSAYFRGAKYTPQGSRLLPPCLWSFKSVTFFFLQKLHLNFFFTFTSVPHDLSLLSSCKLSLKTNHITVFLILSRQKFELKWKFSEYYLRVKVCVELEISCSSIQFLPQRFLESTSPRCNVWDGG